MRSVKWLASALVLSLALLAIAAPAGAKDVPRTGDKISLFSPPSTHPADSAFFVADGFGCEPGFPCLDPSTRFVLWVDGVETHPILDVEVDHGVPVGKTYVSNFRFGLPAGLHTFHGEWYEQGALVLVHDATVDFTP